MSTKSLFLSYSRDDEHAVGPLVADLRSFGHEVWLDEELTGGTPWWHHILNRIRSSDGLVLAVSSSSVASEACQLEWQYAIDTNRGVIPVMLDDGPTLPPMLADFQFVSYDDSDKSAAISLLRAVSALQVGALPDPLPDDPVVPGSYLRDLYERVTTTRTHDLAAQLEIVFTIRQRLEDGRDRAELVQHLRRLSGRVDLLAKVSRDVDDLLEQYDHAEAPGPKKSGTSRTRSGWRAEEKEFKDTSSPAIEIEVGLSSETHMLRFQDGAFYARLFVDGTQVGKSSKGVDDIEFVLSDGDTERQAKVHFRMAWGGGGRLLDLTIVVDGVTLHDMHR